MESNSLPAVGFPKSDSETLEVSVRRWIRLLALREESYHAARQKALDVFEDEYYQWLMQRTAGNRSKAARVAGITRRTVYRLAAHHPAEEPPAPVTEEPDGAIAGSLGARFADMPGLALREPMR
jgi:DNA-binding protein Fis